MRAMFDVIFCSVLQVLQRYRDAIAFHYDSSNGLYQLWLDEAMVRSCARIEGTNVILRKSQ